MKFEAIDREVVESLSRSMLADFRRRGVERHTAEDVIQEAWLRTLLSHGTQPERMNAWLRVVAARILVEFARKQRSRRSHERFAARPERTIPPLSSFESRLSCLAASLPEPYREVIRLRFGEDLEVEEIAHRLGRSRAAVRSQLRRGLEQIRVRVEKRKEREVLGLGLLVRLQTLLRTRVPRGRAVWSASVAIVASVVLLLALGRQEQRGRERLETGIGRTTGQLAHSPAVKEIRTALETLPPPLQPESPVASHRTWHGLVLAPNGLPVAGAQVFRGPSTGSWFDLVATSDEAGRFCVPGAGLEDFLWATHAEYLPSRQTHVATCAEDRSIELKLEAAAGGLELSLRDSKGAALADRPVTLEWDREEASLSITSPDGTLQAPTRTISGLTNSLGWTRLPKPDRARARLLVSRDGQPDLVRDLELERAEQVLDLVLEEPLALAGRVLDAQGRPAQSADVQAVQDDGRWRVNAETDELGRFRIEGLMPGGCQLLAVEDSSRGTDSVVSIASIGDDLSDEVNLQLSPRFTIHGRALRAGVPLAGARVARIDALGEDASASTDEEGWFAIPSCSQGEYDLALYEADSPWPSRVVESVHPGDAQVELVAGESSRTRTLELQFVSPDPNLTPTLVEVSARILRKAVLCPVDRVTGRCDVALPGGQEIMLLAWIPGLGTWQPQGLDLDLPGVQRVVVPEPSTISFTVERPPGASSSPIQGSLRTSSFGLGLRDRRHGTFARRELIALDANTFTVRTMPGCYYYSFLAESLTHAPGKVRADGSGICMVDVRLERGVPVELHIPLLPREGTPQLSLKTANGERKRIFGPTMLLRDEVAIFRLDLPEEAVEILAETSKRQGRLPMSSIPSPMDASPAVIRLELERGHDRDAPRAWLRTPERWATRR